MVSWLTLLLRGGMALAWTALLCLLLLQPQADPLLDLGIPDGDNTLARELAFSAAHLVAFAVTCGLWRWALSPKLTTRHSVLAAVAISLALGCVTELGQTLTADRHFSWLDLGANVAGVLLAARVIWQRRKP